MLTSHNTATHSSWQPAKVRTRPLQPEIFVSRNSTQMDSVVVVFSRAFSFVVRWPIKIGKQTASNVNNMVKWVCVRSSDQAVLHCIPRITLTPITTYAQLPSDTPTVSVKNQVRRWRDTRADKAFTLCLYGKNPTNALILPIFNSAWNVNEISMLENLAVVQHSTLMVRTVFRVLSVTQTVTQSVVSNFQVCGIDSVSSGALWSCVCFFGSLFGWKVKTSIWVHDWFYPFIKCRAVPGGWKVGGSGVGGFAESSVGCMSGAPGWYVLRGLSGVSLSKLPSRTNFTHLLIVICKWVDCSGLS